MTTRTSKAQLQHQLVSCSPVMPNPSANRCIPHACLHIIGSHQESKPTKGTKVHKGTVHPTQIPTQPMSTYSHPYIRLWAHMCFHVDHSRGWHHRIRQNPCGHNMLCYMPGVFGRFDLAALVQPHLKFLFVCSSALCLFCCLSLVGCWLP